MILINDETASGHYRTFSANSHYSKPTNKRFFYFTFQVY